MMDDLYAKFLPQFVQLARGRLERAMDLVARSDATAMATAVRELHAIAGEAGLLGQGAIMALARKGEEMAKKLRDSSADAGVDVGTLAGTMQELKAALELVGPPAKPAG
jgi:HPt (histidine-containing phosphotransfer) domain-containing protein